MKKHYGTVPPLFFFPPVIGGRLNEERAAERWAEEVFEEESSFRVRGSYLGASLSRKTLRILRGLLFLFLFLILGRVWYLQGPKGEEYRMMAEVNRQRIVLLSSERGLIFDRNGLPLTANIPRFALAVVPQDVPREQSQREQVVLTIARLIQKPDDEIRELLETYKSYRFESVVLQDDLDYETALSLHIAAADVPGIRIERGRKRLYNHPGELKSLSHILGYEGLLSKEELDRLYEEGYVPSDTIGKTGIEKSFERLLRGVYGKRRVEVDALGRERLVLGETPPEPGQHIELSIDARLQSKLEEVLLEYLRQTKKERAAGIALDPRTGEVLALVSLPVFDNNDFTRGIDEERYREYIENPNQPFFPRALAGIYPPGSTIKPVFAFDALIEGIITPYTSIVSRGGIQIGQWFFPDWLAGGHGPTDVRKSIAWSVNTFYYTIGGGYRDVAGLGVERVRTALSRFGFGSVLGIELPGEAAGFIPSPEWKEKTKGEPWYIGDTYNLSIGQGDLLVTPLQIASYTAALANGGKLYRPTILRSIVNPVTQEKRSVERELIREEIKEKEHLSIIREGMRDCVRYGSCRKLASLSLPIAGKTGTAQWSSERPPHAWFTSFAPFENPEVVLTILIEEGGGEGGSAVPVAESFYRWWSQKR